MRNILFLVFSFLSFNSWALGLGMTLDDFKAAYTEEIMKTKLDEGQKYSLTSITFDEMPEPGYQIASTGTAGNIALVISDSDNNGNLNMIGVIYPSVREAVTDEVLVARSALLRSVVGDAISDSRDANFVKSIPAVRREGGRVKIINGFKIINQKVDEQTMLLSVENVSNKNPDKARK